MAQMIVLSCGSLVVFPMLSALLSSVAAGWLASYHRGYLLLCTASSDKLTANVAMWQRQWCAIATQYIFWWCLPLTPFVAAPLPCSSDAYIDVSAMRTRIRCRYCFITIYATPLARQRDLLLNWQTTDKWWLYLCYCSSSMHYRNRHFVCTALKSGE